MHLLGEIAVLLGVYKLRILVVRDCLTDVSTILIFVCKNRVRHFWPNSRVGTILRNGTERNDGLNHGTE